jgi:malonyl-CoA O-methyltransferase
MAANPMPPRAAYDLWAATYPPFPHNAVMAAEQAIVEPLLRRLSAARALDVGTGSGRYLPILAAAGARVVGVDFSMAMLRAGTDGSAPPNAGCVCADGRQLPFRRGAFDLINASLMTGDISDLPAWTREAARVLRAGGHLVYSDFHPTWQERGWQRTFRGADGVLRAIAIEPHAIDDHLDALAGAGLRVVAIREPRVKVARRHEPVVVVFHAMREGGYPR